MYGWILLHGAATAEWTPSRRGAGAGLAFGYPAASAEAWRYWLGVWPVALRNAREK